MPCAAALEQHLPGNPGGFALAFSGNQRLHHADMGARDQCAGFPEERQLRRTLDLAHVAHQVVLGHPLDLRGHLFQLQPVFHGQHVRAHHGYLAGDASRRQDIGDALDGVVQTLKAVGRDNVEAWLGLVGDQLWDLTLLHDDDAVGAAVPQHGVGLLSRMGREKVGEVKHVAGTLVDPRGLAKDNGHVIAFVGHRPMQFVPALFVFVEGEWPKRRSRLKRWPRWRD